MMDSRCVDKDDSLATPVCPARPAPEEPLPENIRSVQPGGGWVYRLELAWGRWRRWYLKHFRPGYVRRMAQLRQGSPEGAPHEILDPRDLKYVSNLCTCSWAPQDDPFRWREKLPLARWGLAEVQVLGYPLLGLGGALWWLGGAWTWTAAVPWALAALVVFFFRDPPRRVPQEPGLVVAPADGKVVQIQPLDHHPWIEGPAVKIGIFLTIFNVHLNRSPERMRCVALRYTPGKFLNALDPRSAEENESMSLFLEAPQPPYRRMVVRQISGAIARRIVCAVRPGQVLERGEKFGMIKLGSRTELILPQEESLELLVREGQWVRAGSTPMARFALKESNA